MLTDDYLFHVYDSADSSEMGKHRAGVRGVQSAVLKHLAKMILKGNDKYDWNGWSQCERHWAEKLKQMSEGV